MIATKGNANNLTRLSYGITAWVLTLLVGHRPRPLFLRNIRPLLAALALGCSGFAAAQDLSDANLDDENEQQRDEIMGLLFGHNVAWGASWSPLPAVGIPAGATAHTLNNILKVTKPVLQQPPGVAERPNSADGCSYSLAYTHNVNEVYTDYLGLGPGFNPGAVRLDASWGILGEPTVYHGNSDVRIETTLNGLPFGLPGSDGGFGRVDVPPGRHRVAYTATTQISDLLDIPPWYALGMVGAVDGARKSLGRELLEAAVTGGAINWGPQSINELAGQSGIGSIQPHDTHARTQRVQNLFILDEHHPVVSLSADTIDIQAINVGGRVLTPGLERDIRESTLSYSDRCRQPDELDVRLIAPRFLPVGQDIEVWWRVLDPGPSSLPQDPPVNDPDFPDGRPDDTRNESRIAQVWRIRDTLPPIIEPPSGRVIESAGAQETVTLGTPAVFDLADPQAEVAAFIDGVRVETEQVDLPSLSRTAVTWTATDRSGNSDEKTQWLTVKPVGTNTPPTALASIVSAVSFEDTQIELRGRDDDPTIAGRYDQLSFAISRPPGNGEFIAPLFPFFIEDYRVEANLSEQDHEDADTDGDELVDPLERVEFFRTWCKDPERSLEPLPRDLVNMPEYITVDDDGTSYVRDIVLSCQFGEVRSEIRIAQFNDREELVAELLLSTGSGNIRSFWIGPDGFLYFKVPNEPRVTRVDPTPVVDDPSRPPKMLTSSLVLDPPNDDNGFVRSLRDINSVATDAQNLLYITDGAAVYVFDMLQNEPGGSSESVRFVGDLVPRGAFSPDASTNGDMDMTIDSKGNVYFADEELHRIWKYGPSTYDRANDVFVPGAQLGWLGRCSGNLTPEPACDTNNQRSFGFACTDALCAVDTSARDTDTEREACGLPPGSATFNRRAGCEAGQFDRPRGIAINANDILYVADFYNFRIQRFNTDGMFGGEAISECDGSCFVLGDFGKPIDVSVNQKHFYVLDREFDLLHVFETTPITNVEDANLELVQNAFVTYRSDNNFRGQDSFEFITSDGLIDSDSATLTIDVARNFRAPEAIAAAAETPEDVPVDITLTGADPDDDTLAYAIVDPPANGTLEGNAPNVRYVPNENFQGADAFTFVVDDSPSSVPASTSEPAIVMIEVLPAPDDPTLDIELAERTGVEYDTQFAAYSFDPDVGDVASVTIEWGDGDIEAAVRDTNAIGVAPVIYDDSSFEARVEGTHAYRIPGEYTVRVCVSDSANGASLNSCNEPAVKTLVVRTIFVDELIDLAVTTGDDLPKFEEPDCPDETRARGECPLRSEPVIDGNPVTYTATIDNVQLGDNTSPATNIEATFEFPPELTPRSVSIAAPGAATASAIDGQRVTATISSLAIDAVAMVSVTTDTPGNLVENRRVDISGEVRRVLVVDGRITVPDEFADPGGRNPIARQTTIILDPNGDVDGDGVANGSDAFPGDPTEWSDNDNDGVGDNGDLDDDNDLLPDTWERRFGYDPFNAGEATLDPDGDGLLNAEEYAAGSRPDAADSDRDGLADSVDICPTTFDRNQFDGDQDNRGDACDPQSFAGGVALGDVNDSSSTDFALVETANGDVNAYIKDGETNFSAGANTITIADARSTTVHGIAAVDRIPARLAALSSDTDNNSVIETWDIESGVSTGAVEVFDETWAVAALEPLNLDVPELLIVANDPAGIVGIERRRTDSGALIAAASPLAGYEALATAALDSGDGYAILAYELDTGALELLAASSADDSEVRRWTVSGNDWLEARLVGGEGRYAVVSQKLSGETEVTVFFESSDTPIASFAVYGPDWALIAAEYVSTGLAVMAADGSGEIQIRVVSDADGRELASASYHTSADLPRSLVAGTAQAGALASSASGEVSLELRVEDGSNLRVLTAEATAAPPPPPPPPPPSSGGGGGGNMDCLLLALGMALIWNRRRKAHLLCASRR